MAIKRNAPTSASQELQVSSQMVYRFKPTAELAAPSVKKSELKPLAHYLTRDLLKTTLTSGLIIAIVLVIRWQGWVQ